MRLHTSYRSLALTLAFLSPTIWASDIYSYVDSDGIAHFTNFPDSSRYHVVLHSPDEPKTNTSDRDQAYRNGTELTKKFDTTRVYSQTILREAQANKLDPLFIDAVIAIESNHNPNARSSVGAAGLMQLMPDTAKRYGVIDPYHADSNIRGGTKYLRDLVSLFDGDLNLVLAAYNAGENAVLRNGRRIPPYAETKRYVPKVMNKYAELKRAQIQ